MAKKWLEDNKLHIKGQAYTGSQNGQFKYFLNAYPIVEYYSHGINIEWTENLEKNTLKYKIYKCDDHDYFKEEHLALTDDNFKN